jgi:2-C-methyl-D-erythritol 4-phosphate cytidylyltransferase
VQKVAIITAGGSGTRMGSLTPKQFLLLNNKPLLWYTLTAFVQAFSDIQIILVLPTDYINTGKALVDNLGISQQTTITVGGDTRFHSVKNGLQFIKGSSIVFVHDGVRCMITADLIQRCYAQTLLKGSAIPAVTVSDSVRIMTEVHHSSIDRDLVKIIQTPQTFHSETLLQAFNVPYQPNFTDEASVVEAMGEKVYLIEGEYSNIKVTRPIDLVIAQALLDERKD